MFFNGMQVPTWLGKYYFDQSSPSAMYEKDFGGNGGFGGGNPQPQYMPPNYPQMPTQPQPSGQTGGQLSQMYQGAQLQPQNNTRMMGVWRR